MINPTIRLISILSILVPIVSFGAAKDDIEEFSNIVKSGSFACEEQYTVLYGNGIMSSEQDSKDSLIALEKQVHPKLIPKLKDNTIYKNVYNPTEGFLKDMLEAAGQKGNADLKQLTLWLGNNTLAPKWFQEDINDLIVAHDKARILSSDVTQSHVKIYNSLLAKGRQLAPVTHSQGNLFINEAYFGIDELLKQGMGIVSVANPDDVVADMDQRHAYDYQNTSPYFPGNMFYLNAEEDHLMGLVGTGDWNFDNYIDLLYAPKDKWGHSFIDVYMDTSTTNRPNPTSAQVIVDETIARYDKTTPAKCRTAFFSPPNDLQQWFGKKSKRMVENNGLVEAIDYPTNVSINSPKHTLIDWKGAYESGLATKSLSYVGPSARFMGGEFGNYIFRDGQPFYKAPHNHSILGATLTVDSNDQEWVIAVTGEVSDNFKANYVWRRKVKKIQELSVPDNNEATNPNPDPTRIDEPYWEKLSTLFSDPLQSTANNTSLYTGWFFNGDGTEAQTIRWNKVDYSFPDSNSCSHKEYCFEQYTVTREVNVLERHRINLNRDLSYVSKSNRGYETGDSGVVGVDYLDDEELILRIRNTRSVGDPLNVPVDESTWLEINDEPLMDTRILQCNQNGTFACRPWIFDTEILQDGGLLLNMHALENGQYDTDFRTDIGVGSKITQRNLIHLYHLDMRTKTFEFSTVNNDVTIDQIKQPNLWPTKAFDHISGIDANYYFAHNNEDPVLIGTVFVTKQNVHKSKASYTHAYGNYSDGRAGSFGNMHIGKYLVPPIRGQYLRQNHAYVPPKPIQMGRVVEPDGALLLSYELPGDIFYNYYSKGNLDALAGTSLSNTTVLPVGLN